MNEPVSRSEFAMLTGMVERNADTLTTTAVLGSQIKDVIADVTELRGDLDKHRQQHDQDQRDRRNARRWLIMAGIGFLAAIDGPLLYLITHH